MELWLMSCRVLKRDMECAMLDAIVHAAKAAGLNKLYGYYYPTAKNGMVKEVYKTMGFEASVPAAELPEGSTVWTLDISDEWEERNTVIEIRQDNDDAV